MRILVLGKAGRSGEILPFDLAGDVISRAESLDEALQFLRAGDADMVLIDLEDETEAVEACERLRAEKHRRGVVAASAAGQDATRKLSAAGADFVFPGARELDAAAPLLRKLAEKCAEDRTSGGHAAGTEGIEDLRRFTDELVAQLPSSLFVLDEEMRVMFANRTALVEADDDALVVAGRPFSEVLPAAEEGGAILSAVKGVLQNSVPERILGLHLSGLPGRGEVVVNVSVHPGAFSGRKCVRVTIDDITDEWLAEQGRMREARKLEDIVSAMGAGLATLDSDMLFTWTNRTFAQWFGAGSGRLCSEVFLGSRCGEPDCPARRAVEYGTAEAETWQRYTPDGQRRTFQNSYARVTEPDGRQSLIVVVQDVTPQADRIEQFRLIEQLSRSIQGVRDVDELLHLILTCVTAGHALGFNRAFLFLRNRRTNTLDGRMAVGPGSTEEAHRIWAELAARHRSLEDALREARLSPPRSSPLFRLIRGLRYPLDDVTELPVRVFREKRSALVKNAASDWRLTPDFRSRFGSIELVAVPLVSKGESLGVIVADNLYNERPLDRRALALLETFGTPAGPAIENAEAFADLTESLETLKRTRQQLIDQTKLAAVGRVAAHIAHEIRNPLATIGGFAHSIRSRPDEAERVHQNADTIYDEVRRLERMLSGIMDFSRPARPVLVRQSLNSVVERAVEMLADQFTPKVTISITLDTDTPEVQIDAGQTRQMLINLVRNAAESMPEDAGEIRILTRPDDDGAGAVLVIEDDGPGIPRDLRTRIFEPFFTTKQGGTGLGLAVCRQIVAEHGGKMRVESAEGEGTRFIVTYPAEPAPLPEEAGLA